MASAPDSGSTGPGSSPGRVIVLCSCVTEDALLAKCLSPPRPECKWVPVNCQGSVTKCWEGTYDGLTSHPGGVAILLVA